MTRFVTMLMVSLSVLSACSKQSDQAQPSATPLPTGQVQTVTLDDQGKTINLAVGESFLLQLGEGYNWELTISDQAVLSRVMNITVVRGAQGVYEAHRAGTVTLRATGNPVCLEAQPPCGMPSILFEVTVVIQ